jgi:hypothetical protein
MTGENARRGTRRSVSDGVATISLERPDRRNAMTRHMVQQLCADFDAIDSDDDIRAIIVTGTGRSFCVGADLGGLDALGRGEEHPEGSGRDVGGILALRIFACRKPVIAAVNGDAVGIGVTMTLPMDVRLASSAARFAFPFTRRGIIPETCASWFLGACSGKASHINTRCSRTSRKVPCWPRCRAVRTHPRASGHSSKSGRRRSSRDHRGILYRSKAGGRRRTTADRYLRLNPDRIRHAR